jgi:hypothetical protein
MFRDYREALDVGIRESEHDPAAMTAMYEALLDD